MDLLNKLLPFALAIALFFLALFGYPVVIQIYRNSALSKTVEAKNIHWELVQLREDDWRPKATYVYSVNGKLYSKEEIFQGEKFRNPYKAKEAVEGLAREKKWVWYNPEDPLQATLEKFFPIKRAIYTGILFALLAYFIWGGRIYTTRWLANIEKKKMK